MTVYVDEAENRFGRMIMCHMVADSLDELHSMADSLGLERVWFQFKNPRRPHYDLSLSKRKLAVQKGAVEVGPKEIIEVLRCWYAIEGNKLPGEQQ